jgi:hypothetical protein
VWFDAVKAFRRYTFGGTVIKKIFCIQSQALPNLAYYGRPAESFSDNGECWVYYATRRQLLSTSPWRIVKNLPVILFGRIPYLEKARRDAESAGAKEPLNG